MVNELYILKADGNIYILIRHTRESPLPSLLLWEEN